MHVFGFSDIRYSSRHGAKSVSINFARASGSPVDELLELLSGLEIRDPFGGDVDLLPGLRVAPHPGAARSKPERAESAKLDLFSLAQRLDDGIEDRLDGDLRLLLIETCRHQNLLDQLGFRHLRPSPVPRIRSPPSCGIAFSSAA